MNRPDDLLDMKPGPEAEEDLFPPPFGGIPTFMRAPLAQNARGLDVALVGIPFDGAVSHRPGARHAPREVRSQSMRISPWNYATRVDPFQLGRTADLGDVPLHNPYDLKAAMKDIETFFLDLTSTGASPVACGGDHSISYPILKAMGQGAPLGLIHFDAHCDTGPEEYGSRFTHASPFRNAVLDGVLDPTRAIQIGIRGGSEPLWSFSYEKGFRVIHIEEFHDLGIPRVLQEIFKVVGHGPCYLSFDVDCLDPAFAPGTGTPEVGGMTSYEALQLLRGLRTLDIVGGDVVEISPPYDHSDITTWLGANLLYEILCLVAEARFRRQRR